jgi:predicted DNA-binding transcriptional regulator AlpA
MTPAAENFLNEARLLRPEDLAALMGWSEDTTRAKLARRQCPRFVRIKRCTLFHYSDVLAWIEDQELGEATEVGRRQAAADLLRK